MQSSSKYYKKTLKALKKSPLFCNISQSLLESMMDLFKYEVWPSKRTIMPDDIKNSFHIIISGRLEITKINQESGRMIILNMLEAGDGFDLMQLLSSKPCDGIMQVRDDVELISVPINTVKQWLIDYPEFNVNFLLYLGKQMRLVAELAGDLALHDTETRLARLIVRHIDKRDLSNIHLELINDLPHDVLAEMIGSVRIVVNRQLQHWRKNGIVSLEHGHIHVENLEKLLALTNQYLLPNDVN